VRVRVIASDEETGRDTGKQRKAGTEKETEKGNHTQQDTSTSKQLEQTHTD